LPGLGDVLARLLGGDGGLFFRVRPSLFKNRAIAAGLDDVPPAARRACISAIVISGVSRIQARMSCSCRVSGDVLNPPNRDGPTSPVSSTRCISLITQLTLT
jgi:hypothetical protein